jgi:hypothetical protein
MDGPAVRPYHLRNRGLARKVARSILILDKPSFPSVSFVRGGRSHGGRSSATPNKYKRVFAKARGARRSKHLTVENEGEEGGQAVDSTWFSSLHPVKGIG